MSKAVEVLIEIRDLLKANVKPLLDIHETAALIGCCSKSVQRWESRGRMPLAVHSPAGPRWRREELLKWINTLKPRKKKPRRRIVEPDSPTS